MISRASPHCKKYVTIQNAILTALLCALPSHCSERLVVDIPEEATQEEGHSGFLHLHLTGLVVVLIQQGCSCFLARRSSSRILCMNELVIPHSSDYVLSKQ